MKKSLILLAAVILVIGLIVGLTRHHGISRTTAVAPSGLYVALGDSVAAGLGLDSYSDASACDRTTQAYPNQVAASKHLKLISLACSGATTSAGILGTQTVNQATVQPQLDQLFMLTKPKLVSVTIGANDMGWTDILTKCYTTACGTDEDTAAVDGRLSELTANLHNALQKIADHYGQNPPSVVITGYYQLLPSSLQSCPEMTGLDTSELAWERAQEDKLNTTLAAVSSGFSFSTFAPVNFSGHELCSTDSWVQGISANAPFHPTSIGQQTYARAIL